VPGPKTCFYHILNFFIIFVDDTCAVCYFYLTFNIAGLENPLDVYEEIDDLAREEVLANGGSLSR
jgi:alkyldihydroxyacetonephosphate synthase